jgi:hypothetical protein
MKRSSETISFRADTDLARLIDTARSPFGISRGDWVRGVVIAQLHRGEASDLDVHVTDLRKTLEELQTDAHRLQTQGRRMMFTLLTLLGHVPSDEAKTIVQKVFLD